MRPPRCHCCEIGGGTEEVPIITEFAPGTIGGPNELHTVWYLCEACYEEDCEPWADKEQDCLCKLYPGEELGYFEGDIESVQLRLL